ncbi:hypothetical protein E1A91_D10G287300v1 [Gossypium mustelinum]|uniref:Uncharacterized protein n=1 Tax=Gossypium mustelinum TaxID=34275 RepID=A0A5D2TEC1_GOSMU|nr:hypothetical protein E1A91_D10G287300v1 [Gossypium mustelinum]
MGMMDVRKADEGINDRCLYESLSRPALLSGFWPLRGSI